jgi:hypothetical protein
VAATAIGNRILVLIAALLSVFKKHRKKKVRAVFTFNTMTTAEDLQKRVDEIQRGLATSVRGAELDFGQRIKQAVDQRVRNSALRTDFTASVPTDAGESFAEQIKKAVARRTQQHRDNAPYRPSRSRLHTASD